MPDPWLTEEELDAHNKEVEKHPLSKQADEARKAHEKDAEELHKEQQKNRKKVEEGELVEVRANGAVVGYRDAEEVEKQEQAELDGAEAQRVTQDETPVDSTNTASGTEPKAVRRAKQSKPKEEQKDSGNAPEDQPV